VYKVYLALLSSDAALQSLGGRSSSNSSHIPPASVDVTNKDEDMDDGCNNDATQDISSSSTSTVDLASVFPDLVDAVISATEGERDPRTLLLSLGLMRRLLTVDSFDHDIIDSFADRVI
jgi:hypothetical protein